MGDIGSSEPDGWVEQSIDRLSLAQLVGQLVIQYVYGAEAEQPDPRNLERYGVATPAEVVAKYCLGGVVYFAWSDNLIDPEQIRRLSSGLQQASLSGPAGVPLDLSVDQETGRVVRFAPPVTEFPGARALGVCDDLELTRAAFEVVGRELSAMGISTDYAPDADVNLDPDNPVIGIRSFGADPAAVARHVGAATEGLHAAGVGAVAKHFPGHGDTSTDSHTALPVITHTLEQWRVLDAPPFAAAIAAGVDEIMTAHIAVPELDPSGDPATLSRPIMRLLRDDLGYDGLVITDSLQMAGVRARYDDGEIAVRALSAGVDLLLMPADPDAVLPAVTEALRTGRLSLDRLRHSVRRLLRMKQARGLVSRPPGEPDELAVIGCQQHRTVAAEVATRAVTLLRDDRALLPLADVPVLVLGAEAQRTALSAALVAAGVPAREADVTDPSGVVASGETVVALVDGGEPEPALVELVRTPQQVGRLIVVGVEDERTVDRFGASATALVTSSATGTAMRGLASVLTGGPVVAHRTCRSMGRVA